MIEYILSSEKAKKSYWMSKLKKESDGLQGRKDRTFSAKTQQSQIEEDG